MNEGARPSCWHVFESGLGWVAASWRDDAILRLTFAHPDPQSAAKSIVGSDVLILQETDAMKDARRQIRQFAAGKDVSLQAIAVNWQGYTPFQQKVLSKCRTIAWGEVVSYAQLAGLAGSPRAARAVGGAMRCNQHPLVIPCHRVVGAGGRLGGYSAAGGKRVKRDLLLREGNDLEC